jgi:hypothetical protein
MVAQKSGFGSGYIYYSDNIHLYSLVRFDTYLPI